MHRFFVEDIDSDTYILKGKNAGHAEVLRLAIGEPVVLCDGAGSDYIGELIAIAPYCVKISHKEKNGSEPLVKISLFQALPKNDKMELVVQKAVELGVYEIVPILSCRCVKRNTNTDRLQKIAESAAKQSHRGIIPKIHPLISIDEAYIQAQHLDAAIICHENAEYSLSAFLRRPDSNLASLGCFIGPEGGFSTDETKIALPKVSLGRRILRAETAAIAALANIFYELES